jgi:hypothetical protein
MLTQEELDRVLQSVNWGEIDPAPDDKWKKESEQRLIKRLERLQIHWHHVRIWREVCCSAVAATLVVGWFVGTAPLRTAIHATAQLPSSTLAPGDTARNVRLRHNGAAAVPGVE